MKGAIWAFLFPVVLTCGACSKAKPIHLPEIDEIAEMHVELEGLNRALSNWDAEEEEVFRFAAPRDHWEAILDAFRPYKRGTTAKKVALRVAASIR